MKKFFITMLFLIPCIGMFAQKGEKSVGVNINYGTTAKSVGLGAKFQYGITDKIRIEPSLTYYFGGTGMLDITGNVHYLFDINPKINVYPLAGIGFDLCRYETYNIDWYEGISTSSKETASCFKFNIGGGAEYAVAENISIGLELKYDVITDGYSQFVVGVGAKYKF